MTHETIQDLKEKHGRIFKLTAETKQGKKVSALVRAPDRKTLSAAMKLGKDDPMKFNEIILKNIWLEGDEELRTDQELVMGVYQQLGEVIKVADVQLEEL